MIKTDDALRLTVTESGQVITLQAPTIPENDTYSWTKRVSVTISAALLSNTATSFPLLLLLNSSNFPFAEGSSDGSDIRFSFLDDPGPSDFLSHDFLFYSQAGQSAAFWVKLPVVQHQRATSFNIFFTGTPSGVNYEDFSGTWDDYLALFHTEDSNLTTVPLYAGLDQNNAYTKEYSEGIGSNMKGIAAKSFANRNLANFKLQTAAAPLMILELKSSVWEFFDNSGRLEITSSGKPGSEALRSPVAFARGLNVRDDWTTVAISMLDWENPSASTATGTASVAAGSTRVRRASTSAGDEDDFAPGDGLFLAHGTAGVEAVGVKRLGPLPITGMLCCESGSATVKGIDTTFTTDVQVGDIIYIEEYKVGVVAALGVVSDTELTLTANATKDVGDFSAGWGESGYVGDDYTIFEVWNPVAATHSGVTIKVDQDAIDYSTVNFLRWTQYFQVTYGSHAWRNARIQYTQLDGDDAPIADSGTTLIDNTGNYCTLERMAGGGNKPVENDLGVVNKGMHFDGTGGYLRFNRSLDIETNSWSFGCWIKAETGSTELRLLGNSRFSVLIDTAGVVLSWDEETIRERAAKTGLLTNGSLHFIVIVRDKPANRFYCYIDGVQYLLDTWAGEDMYFRELVEDEGGEPVYIGADAYGEGVGYTIRDADDFIGTISEIFLCLRPLSAAWVEGVYKAVSSPTTYVSLGSIEKSALLALPNGIPVDLGQEGTLYVGN